MTKKKAKAPKAPKKRRRRVSDKQLDFFLIPPRRDTAAYVRGSGTSRAAAASLGDHLARLQFLVLDFIRLQGMTGATDDECEIYLKLRHQTASARRRELVLKDYIIDSERTRPTRSGRQATIWVVNDRRGEAKD
jgi:hypothetical protein